MWGRGVGAGFGFLALICASVAAAQGNLDQGKSGAQLYASACASCHKSPSSPSSARWFFGLESFLREHYTSSRESAALLAAYLKAQEKAVAETQRGRVATALAYKHFGIEAPRSQQPLF